MFIWNKGDLNSDQEQAILEEESILLMACPGSGKTRTLTYKIAYELSRLHSEKHFLIAITYTNTAANEIKERVELLGVNVDQLWIGTIHSFCVEWILKPYYSLLEELKYGFRIINSYETEEILKNLCEPYKKQKITHYDCSYVATKEGYEITCPDSSKHKSVDTILSEYFQILDANNQIDFEQILYYSFKILDKNPLINGVLCNIFPYILIDEYQDTKQIQYDIVTSILSAKKGDSKLLIVGDPNQSIYNTLGGFPMSREAIEILLQFPLQEYSLSKNYRSSGKIIKYFHYYKTYPNLTIPYGSFRDYDSAITFNSSIDRSELVDEIVRLINFNINEKHIKPNEICIAAPQWVHLASMTRSLMIKLPDLSFNGPGMAPFSRDIENFWFRLSRIVLTEPSPTLYLRRLRWSREVIEALNNAGVDVKETGKSFLRLCNSIKVEEENGLDYLKVFFSKITDLLEININAHLTLKEHYDSFFNSSEKRIERLVSEGNEFIGSIESFRKVFRQRDGITVSTIHGVKGEEYDTMIGFALLDDYVPHFSDSNGNINSKKMLYVLASRARKNLHFISEKGRSIHEYYAPEGKPPTPHLLEYNYDYDELL